MTSLLRRYPLAAFCTLAYLGSWVAWSPWWLAQNGIGLLPVDLSFTAVAGINQLGLFAGPFGAAYLLTRLTAGKEGIRGFWRRFVQARVRLVWYVLALLAVPAAAGAGYLLTPQASPALDGGIATVVMLLSTYVVYLFGGPVQEEVGWRGFALPRLQQRLHPMIAALVLGVIHCLWHAPLFLTDDWDTARQDGGQFLAYLILVVSMSYVMSWLANGSRGSVLLVILGHNGINWAPVAVATVTGQEIVSNWPAALGLALLAALSIIVTRGRLGYRAAEQSSQRPSLRT